jgi:hypothetical protein
MFPASMLRAPTHGDYPGQAKRESLVSTQPFLGFLLYVTFVVLIFFIFLKLFITTLGDSYQHVM